jgi:hypothetical protein
LVTAIMTYAGTNVYWVEAYFSEVTPSFNGCDRVLAINLNIKSSELIISDMLFASKGEGTVHLSVEPGSYIVYILNTSAKINEG